MMRTFLFLLLAATPSKSRYSLTQTGSPYSTDSLTLSADIELAHKLLASPILHIHFKVAYAGLTPDTVELNELAFQGPFVRIDEGDWVRCNGNKATVKTYADDDVKKEMTANILCRIDAQPLRTVELRFMTTRLGADVDAELQFSGIGKGSENK